jgi:hypothetical protein
VFLSKRTEADFREWRDARDWHARKYAMWARGEKMPSQKPSSLMRCPCGEKFDSHDPARSYVHRGHIYAAHAADGIRRQMRCLLCEDCGWVCEAHPDRPWEGEHACRCGGRTVTRAKMVQHRGCRRASRPNLTRRAGAIDARQGMEAALR